MVDRAEYWMFSTDDEDDIPDIPVRKRSRKSLAEKHPQLPVVVDQFVKDNSAEAHNRRRNATAYSNGVTLKDIQQHVQDNVPGLESISKMTIHRLMKPSRKGTTNSKRHKGLVDARVPPKRNDATKDHPDFRFTCASVNYVNELAVLCDDECVSFSCDDKNKVNVGTLAVSRHFQIKRFFSTSDAPNYPDHDFPFANSKLIPSGYMRLTARRRARSLSTPEKSPAKQRRSRSSSPTVRGSNLKVDKTGRNRVTWPRTGPLHVFLQAAKFHNSTSQNHTDHLYKLLDPIVNDKLKPRSVVTLLADGGPDWSTKSLVNLINYGRLWRDLKLDGLVIVCYAPRNRRFNPIERTWGPLSKWLTGVTLPRTLEGEDVPPVQQTTLTADEIATKEAQVFDNAVTECSKYWQGKMFDRFPITVHPVPCRPADDTESYDDHGIIKAFVETSAARILSNAKFGLLRKELVFFLAHCVRRSYQLEFYKCSHPSCDHCTSNPIHAVKFFDILTSFGGKLPSPVSDPARSRGEYVTLLRLLDIPTYVDRNLDVHLPSGKREVCQKGCQYVFLSEADKKRHHTLVHSKKL